MTADNGKEITCREFIDFMMNYIDENMPVEQRMLFDQHLNGCDDCVDYLATYRQTVSLSAAVYDPEWEPKVEEAPEDLILAILQSRKP